MNQPIVRFGLIADPQYAALPPWQDRHYARSLAKLEAALDELNRHDLAFVATLGDVIDRDWASFADILPIYERARHPCRFVLGNHDFAVASERLAEVPAALGLDQRYGSFAIAGIRFVLLDSTETSLFAHPQGSPAHQQAEATLRALEEAGAINAQPWNGGMGDVQARWLAEELGGAASRGERVVVLSHYPVFPSNAHNMWGDAELVTRLTASGTVVAHFSGHNHDGNYGVVGGTHFVNLTGMVETADTNAFAIVDLHADRLEIRGFGREPTRSLAL
ncbi:MAG: metallophosphoesterase [Pseudomonadota bacterium]